MHSNHVGEQKCDLKKTEWKKQGYLRLRNCPTKAAEPIKRGAQRVAMNLVLRINREELRPARRQARLPHSRSLLLPGREG